MITSNSNNLIKLVSSLHNKKGRQEHKLYLAEGIHLVQEALLSKAPVKYFFWSPKLTTTNEGRELLEAIQGKFEGYEVSDSVLGKICETQNPQGIIAVISIPDQTVLDLTGFNLGVIIDGLQDPGNVGTIIRTAWAGALDGLLMTPETADPFQGKVVRASMGGIFHQFIHQNLASNIIMAEAKRKGVQIVAGDVNAEEVYYDCDLTLPTLLLIGNEGRGLKGDWEKNSIKKVFIPLPGKAESLNVSVSAGILIYEAIRQRSMSFLRC